MKKFFACFLLLCLAHSIEAAVQTEVVEYKDGDTVLEGYLVYDDTLAGKRPGVLVVHEWMGLGPHAQSRARQLAELGYIAFAVDMYGKGIRPQDQKEAAYQASIYKNDRSLMRRRILTGLEVLKNHPLADMDRLAATGYCFGGTTVLELARSGTDIRGVVSFHGGLSTPSLDDAKNIKAKILVLHGADDPFVPPEEVKNFEAEMRSGNVDWQFIAYGGAVHSFTNKEAGTDNSKGAAYNLKADKRSWEAMKSFLKEIF